VDIDGIICRGGEIVDTSDQLWALLPAEGDQVAALLEITPWDSPWPGPRHTVAKVLRSLSVASGVPAFVVQLTPSGPLRFKVLDLQGNLVAEGGPEEFARWRAALRAPEGHRLTLHLSPEELKALVAVAAHLRVDLVQAAKRAILDTYEFLQLEAQFKPAAL
jgi:hypothetical protein